ncbi:HET-domain-containing protein [Trematosphaeria pertusa]|uniref:HET-domain-containing protein n=1 Tax=Trematosphaeria pertusa TaxID=390896 RepID=A0A6A6IA61_9PLEO|nr:HET-domain-containing protein [Trematosphaeria pertusa]KAF2247117.1 HET-domain-containing protein [Trematosphaeria pertusa]
MADHYKYHPLDRSKREIRLSSLLPNDGTRKSKLIPACHLFHVALDEKPNFTALSYVWGDPKDRRVILVDGFPISVTRNLYDAMMVLRPANAPITIWIDALCINQADDEEKSWQVGLMAEIYGHSSKVVAWLGPADQDSDSVMDYLNDFGARAEACGAHHSPAPYMEAWNELAAEPGALRPPSKFNVWDALLDDLISEASADACGIDREPKSYAKTWRKLEELVADGRRARIPRRSEVRIQTPAGQRLWFSQEAADSLFYSISGWHDQHNLLPLDGIKRLFTRKWWERVWVLQEIALPEDAEFLCGAKRIERRRCTAALNAFTACQAVLASKFTNDPQALTPYQVRIGGVFFQHRATVMLASWSIYRDGGFPLVALLRATCEGSEDIRKYGPHHLKSTDPRDKVFALLGIASDREELLSLGLYPDYTKSFKETYKITMVALLRQGHVSLLSMCQTPKLIPELPSWVPDWSGCLSGVLQSVEGDHVTLLPAFSASGAESFQPEVIIRSKYGAIEAVALAGCIYDEICEVGSFPNERSSRKMPLPDVVSRAADRLIAVLLLTYTSKEGCKDFRDRMRAAVRTSVGGVRIDEHKDLARVGDDRFVDAIELLQSFIKHIKHRRIKVGVQNLVANGALKGRIGAQSQGTRTLLGEILGKSMGQLPCITRKGHLVLCSEHVKRSDVVALIRGAQVPFVVHRRNDGRYQLISEAYVDGIMDGEAVENCEWGLIDLV